MSEISFWCSFLAWLAWIHSSKWQDMIMYASEYDHVTTALQLQTNTLVRFFGDMTKSTIYKCPQLTFASIATPAIKTMTCRKHTQHPITVTQIKWTLQKFTSMAKIIHSEHITSNRSIHIQHKHTNMVVRFNSYWPRKLDPQQPCRAHEHVAKTAARHPVFGRSAMDCLCPNAIDPTLTKVNDDVLSLRVYVTK